MANTPPSQVRLINAEKVLLAGSDLTEAGNCPFSAEALIVTSWQKFPDTFGLAGYTQQYPDANKVLALIFGQRGLILGQGWLAREDTKLYRLTTAGQKTADSLRARVTVVIPAQPPGQPPLRQLKAGQERLLRSLLATTAAQRFAKGAGGEVNFSDACRFWGLPEDLPDNVLEQINSLKQTLAEILNRLHDGSARLKTGQAVTTKEVLSLLTLHDYLRDRFQRHLGVLSQRITARK